MRTAIILASLTALSISLAAPPSAPAEACPAPSSGGENSNWLFVSGKNPTAARQFPFLRARVKVGRTFTIDTPLGECMEGLWESGDATLAIGNHRGRPALGRGVELVGASGISTPALRGDGLLWPQTRVSPGEWGHRSVQLRITSPGTYFFAGASSQVSIGNHPGVWSDEPQLDPRLTLDRRNPYLLGVTARGHAQCGSARFRDGALEMARARQARRHPSRFRGAAAFSIRRRGLDCADVEAVLARTLNERDELNALAALGYRVTRFARSRIRGRRSYEIDAERDRERVSYRRYGSLRIDHSLYRAGQHIDIFHGFSPDNLSMLPGCTGAYALAIPGLPGQVGLTAAHCHTAGRVYPDRAAVNRGFAGDGGGDAPQLGVMLRAPNEYPDGLDATIFSIFLKWGVAQQIERGGRPPLTVDGWLPTAEHLGKKVCIAGRVSGADVCGRVVKCPRYVKIRASTSWCANYKSQRGDSGGPVYLAPGRGLSTRAVGIVEGSIRTTSIKVYAPIEQIMAAFNATLPTGPVVRGPIDVPPGGGF